MALCTLKLGVRCISLLTMAIIAKASDKIMIVPASRNTKISSLEFLEAMVMEIIAPINRLIKFSLHVL